MRLQKFLAEMGIASRRQCAKLIIEGRVKVNGVTVLAPGNRIDTERDVVEVDGHKCQRPPAKIYLMLNKPKDYLTTLSDPFGRLTIKDLLEDISQRVFPVGRLDKDVEGLIILTNDGWLAYRLMHPRYKIYKSYIAKAKGILSKEDKKQLEEGLKLKSGEKFAPAKVKITKKEKNFTWLEIKIFEGRKRQIKKMLEALKHPVVYLKRIGVGPISLGRLECGKYRFLTEQEVSSLKKMLLA